MRVASRAILLLMALTCFDLSAQETRQSPHGKLSWDCLDCHNTESWAELKPPLKFEHEGTGFALVGQHAKAACGVCHRDLRFSYVGTACADCHTDVHRGQFGNNCQNCHSPQSWQNRRDNFELHASRGFPLVGVHAITDCGACHIGQQRNEFAGISQECGVCHKSNFEESDNPNHALAGFSGECQKCHQPVAASWRVTSFRHAGEFTLRAAHARAECSSCHTTRYAGTSTECYPCHTQDFNATTDPAHATFGFPTACEACHSDLGWETAQFDHVLASEGFALNGAHNLARCIDCHVNNQMENLPRECYGCHQSDYAATTDPSHAQNNFPQTCLSCHNENAWAPATFDHNLSQFPLTGAHASVACNSCHAAGYTNTPTDCFACHDDNYNSATDPNHVANNFDHNCTQCHNTTAWQPSTFNHAGTQFPLTGAHMALACVSCHAAGYQNTPTACYSCHQDDYNGATDPNHAQNNFDHNCAVCHNTAAWEPSTFNHANTQFPLTGAHLSVQCIDCHAGGYQIPFDCWSCHEADYHGAENHDANNFPRDCTQCHNTTDWGQNIFNHAGTQFPLTGAHLSIQCIACHATGYQDIPAECYACHQGDYSGVADPNHVADNFSQVCTQCHTTAAWLPATFNHSQSQFPLTGAHVAVQCAACHTSGFDNTPTACYSCHQGDFDGAADPNHVAGNYSHTCTQCHTTNGWTPATFNHSATQFPLTGAHINAPCLACHANGYDNTPILCYACHQSDYNGAVPNHQASSFPTVCQNCHNTAAWIPSTWNHDALYFPIYSGRHQERWSVCADCHVNPNDYNVFECILCHEHSQPETDPRHTEVPGYQYNSQACYSCHPRGEAGGG